MYECIDEIEVKLNERDKNDVRLICRNVYVLLILLEFIKI